MNSSFPVKTGDYVLLMIQGVIRLDCKKNLLARDWKNPWVGSGVGFHLLYIRVCVCVYSLLIVGTDFLYWKWIPETVGLMLGCAVIHKGI